MTDAKTKTRAKPRISGKTASKAGKRSAPARRDASISIAFVVNDVATEKDYYTTIRLARKAVARGHTVALIGLGDFIY
ncbi:MAG: hypothetical protein MEP44_04010, partial [Blastomonas sp.]|nr:hypothetical protein [Blastomonas sp.]